MAPPTRRAARPFNARAETAARLPTFRDSFRRRRSLVPADGFYEWQVAGLARVPHHFRLVDGAVMALAWLWDVWASPAGEKVATCCVLTTEANDRVRHAHPRMPVVLPAEAWDAWLSPATPAAELATLLRPFPAEQTAGVIVGPAVYRASNDGPECVRPGGLPDHTADPFELGQYFDYYDRVFGNFLTVLATNIAKTEIVWYFSLWQDAGEATCSHATPLNFANSSVTASMARAAKRDCTPNNSLGSWMRTGTLS